MRKRGIYNFFSKYKTSVTNEDLENITNKRMLSDNVIHGFDILCKRHFEHVEGFQDLLLGQTLQNSVIKYQKFEQILHKYQHL